MSNNVKIIIIVGCLVLAVGIFCFTSGIFSGSSDGGDGKIWLKCTNPGCGQSYSVTLDEFQKLQSNGPGMMPMMPGQPPQAFKCIKCGKQSAYMAQKCEKCGNVFVSQMPAPGQANQDFPDRCPKCGNSAMEQAEKSQK